MKEKKRRVIGIKRVSTPGQAADDKYGLARQDEDIRLAAKAHDLEIIRVIEVVESGSTAFRGEDFKQVFEDLARPDVAGAAVSAVDRLIRPGFLGDLAVFDPFQRHGKMIFTPSQVIDVRTDGGYLMAGMFGMSAGLEKRAIAKRTAGGRERARVAGKHPGNRCSLPRGLEYIRERDEHGRVIRAFWRYDGQDSKRVMKAYDLLFAGMSFGAIAEAVGFQSARGVALILRNTCWKGIRTFDPNGSRALPLEMPMGITPLISAEKWAQAQKILDEKLTKTRARKRQEYNISIALGLLRCRCGRFHYLRRDYRPHQGDLFYCASRVRGERCGSPSIRRTVADAAVLDAITKFGDVKTVRMLVEQALKKPAQKAQPAATTQRDIARVTGERDRLIDLRVKGKITEEQFDQRDQRLAGELRDLEALLPKPEAVIDSRILASAIAGLFAEFPYLPLEEQYKLARRVFVAFDVAEDGTIERAIMRGETLAQAYAKNGTRSSATK